jgi:hypothetical protein
LPEVALCELRATHSNEQGAQGDELGERLKAARRASVPPAAIFAGSTALFGGAPDGRARDLGAERASA